LYRAFDSAPSGKIQRRGYLLDDLLSDGPGRRGASKSRFDAASKAKIEAKMLSAGTAPRT
jgi:hypothetical protein